WAAPPLSPPLPRFFFALFGLTARLKLAIDRFQRGCTAVGLAVRASSNPLRRDYMKKTLLTGLALGAALAFSTGAYAADLKIAVAGPVTGPNATFGKQLT